MKKLLVASSAIFAVTMAGAANAEPPGPGSWTGFYIGGNAGYGAANDAIGTGVIYPGAKPVDIAAVGAAASPSFNPGGFVGGAQTGYNRQMGRIVVGVEADAQYIGLRGASGISSIFPSTRGTTNVPFNVNTAVSTNWLVTARPRAGYLVTPALLLYGTGGLAVTDDRFSQTAGLANGFTVSSSSTNRIGWTIGAGVEYAVDDHWSAKAEYLYADFGKANALGTLTPAASGFEWANSYHLTTSIGRLGVNYKFW
jgi:outer membrane immunogenic protein